MDECARLGYIDLMALMFERQHRLDSFVFEQAVVANHRKFALWILKQSKFRLNLRNREMTELAAQRAMSSLRSLSIPNTNQPFSSLREISWLAAIMTNFRN
jgi:hypothetical protein